MDQSASDQALTIFIDDRQQLIRLALRIVESRAIAEEIVQESWIRWHRHDYEPARAKPIFRKIVANLARDWRRNKTTELIVLNELYELRSHAPSAEAAVMARSELILILKVLRSMPKRNVRAFRMRALEGKTYKQISGRLKLSISHSHALVESVLVELTLALER
ncbi:MAG: sigma-70 family RNA polymerase sigma factor [Pseudomonadota bacterium]